MRTWRWRWGLLPAALALTIMSFQCATPTKHKPAPKEVTQTALPGPSAEEASMSESIPQETTESLVDDAAWQYLQTNGWDEHAGARLTVWISVEEQMFRIVQGREILWSAPCATAAKGTGSVKGSNQTPLGWHTVKRKTGDGAPWGQVFRGGQASGQVWKPGQTTKEDLVLTRVLFLDGLEPGRNKGGNVDSYERYIYIHGTNDEAKIGTPSSHGCIRLTNDNAIAAYDLIPTGTPVLITERTE